MLTGELIYNTLRQHPQLPSRQSPLHSSSLIMHDVVEYYLDGASNPMFFIRSSIVPRPGSTINIKGTQYLVHSVSYAIDHSEDLTLRSTRANVELKTLK